MKRTLATIAAIAATFAIAPNAQAQQAQSACSLADASYRQLMATPTSSSSFRLRLSTYDLHQNLCEIEQAQAAAASVPMVEIISGANIRQHPTTSSQVLLTTTEASLYRYIQRVQPVDANDTNAWFAIADGSGNIGYVRHDVIAEQ